MADQGVSIIINNNKGSSEEENIKENPENQNKGTFSIESEDDGYPD